MALKRSRVRIPSGPHRNAPAHIERGRFLLCCSWLNLPALIPSRVLKTLDFEEIPVGIAEEAVIDAVRGVV